MSKYWVLYFIMPCLWACEETLKVGADLNWPPYSYMTDLEPVGIDIDAAKAIFESAGFCLFFIDMPSSVRAIEEIHSGNIDVLMAASLSKNRAQLALFSDAYRRETVRLFSHVNSIIEADSILEAFEKGGTFAVNTGSYIGESFQLFMQQYAQQIVFLPSSEQRLMLLNSGRVDFVVEDSNAAQYIRKNLNLKNVIDTPLTVYENDIHFMLNQQRFKSHLLPRVNAAIADFQ